MTDSKALIEQLRGDAAAYLKSVYDPDPEKVDVMFTLDYQWTDKPHRHIGDLCGKINEAADHIEKLEADNARLREALESIVNSCGQCGGYGTYPE